MNCNRREFLRNTAGFTLAALGMPLSVFAERNPMTITGVDVYGVRGGKCFVIIRTSEGITGIGEASPMNSGTIAHLIHYNFRPLLLGMNPLHIDRLWELIFYRTYKQGVMGLQPEALSAIDIALWDILGKVANLPISTLMGGTRRDDVRMYYSFGGVAGRPRDETMRAVEYATSLGFTAIKIRMGYRAHVVDVKPEWDIQLMKDVRSVIGDDVELMYDVNNGYSVSTAIKVGRALEEIGVMHYEEPLQQTDYKGYAQLVDALDVPIAAGEHEYTRWQFRDLIEQANVDVVQPDVVKCAGLSEGIKIATLASTHHKKLVPHQTQPTIGMAANLHYVAAYSKGNDAQECSSSFFGNSLHDLFEEELVYENGIVRVPEGAGLGLTLNEERLKEMTDYSYTEN